MSDGESGAPEDDPPSDGHGPDSDDSAPLSDLARRVSRKRRDRSDQADRSDEEPAPDLDAELSDGPPPDPDDDPFDRMSVGEIDEETLWSSLGGDDDTAGVGVDTDPLDGIGAASGVESVGDIGAEVREHVVPKDTYCQSCPYLDEPPALACTHEGTEILEVVDSERFRVRNCPMVEGGVEPE
jgi:hypothetical protein